MSVISQEGIENALQEKVLAAGVDPGSFFPQLRRSIGSTPDPSRALTNLSRFLDAGFSSSALKEFASHPTLLTMFLELVGQSQYLADILVRNPEWFHWLTSTGELQRMKSAEDLRGEARASMEAFGEGRKKRDALKRFHRREILRIGAMDILGEAPVQDIVAQLSALADITIGEAVSESYRTILTGWDGSTQPRLCVIALGKLGGQELNFSSDIDLMFVYDQDAELSSPIGRVQTMHELCVRLSESVVEYLSGFSGEGYFYRVDMRLRPDGRSGPLALSRSGYLTYYETRGERWERQMLIKARCVAGDREVGELFLKELRPFVFPRTVLNSPWSDIASMKHAIEKEFRTDTNIKLGAGGIRDVEFLVQGLQMVHGGANDDVRSSNTLRTLQALAQRGIIPEAESSELSEAYRLFRDIEHRLQLFHGFQTHELPVSQQEYALLARKLGYSTRSFRLLVSRHRRRVRIYFTDATGGMSEDEGDTLSESERTMIESLSVEPAHRLRRGVLADVRRSGVPEIAARRLGALLSDAGVRSVLREGLLSRRLRADIVTSITFSSMVFERLSADPLLLESLIGQATMLLRRAQPGWSDLIADDPARYKRYNEVRSAIRFLTGRSSMLQFESELTQIAETVLQNVCSRLSLPRHMLVLGAGKLGSAEMGISSDLDLVLFFDEKHVDGEEAQRNAKLFSASFASPTKSYDVDFRLRPEGRNAPLAAGVAYLDAYLRTRADLWEAMALKRSRLLWGTDELRHRFAALLRSIEPGTSADIVEYVRAMRSRMEQERDAHDGIDVKVGSGGIVDIEFIAQAGQLMLSRKGGRTTLAAIRSLRHAGLVRQREVHMLSDALSYLRTIESLVRLNSATSISTLKDSGDVAELVASFMKMSSVEKLVTSTRGRMATVRRVFDGIFDRWKKA